MELSNMLMASLKGKAIEQIASQVGGDSKMVKSIAAKALPKILGGLESNVASSGGAQALSDALVKHDGSVLENMGQLNISDSSKILGHIFGGSSREIDDIANETGASKEDSEKVTSLLSSVVMGALGKQKAQSGLGAEDLVKMLSGTGKDTHIFALFDQDGDGDFDTQDAMKFGMNFLKKKFLGK